MADNIVIGKSLRINGARPLDYLYGPYKSIEDLKRSIPAVLRYKGLTGAVENQYTGIKEYWFKSGITDADLIEKLPDLTSTLSNWEEENENSPNYIQNKPDIPNILTLIETLYDKIFNVIVLVLPKTLTINTPKVSIDIASTLKMNSIKIKRNNILILENLLNTNSLDYVDTVPSELLVSGTTITYTIEAIFNNFLKTVTKTVSIGENLIPAITLQWSNNSYTTYIDSGFTPTYPILIGGNNLDIIYTSSNLEVATISNSGVITAIAPGTTIISAYFGGNNQYSASNTATYTLQVVSDSTTSLMVSGSINPDSITTEETAIVSISGAILLYLSGYSVLVPSLNLTITATGGVLNGITFTPTSVGTAYINISYGGLTTSMNINVTLPSIQRRNVEFGVGATYNTATWVTVGQLADNLSVNGISNNVGDYLFVKYDKNDTVNSLWINSSISSQLDLDSPVEDGDYKYRKTTTYRLASRSPIDYIINKI